ncbi:MAG: phosphohydrolase [Euryarchaeota archaeon]|nr:phosphohydrolase [Euryarchaeota archaeon]
MLTRSESLSLVREHVKKENNVKHMIGVGAVMRQLAIHLGQDDGRWEVVGILHDVDFEECSGMCDHTLIAKGILAGKVDDEVVEAIMAHNHEMTKVPVDTVLKKGLIASDAVSGLVVACALVMPSKKLADVRPESIVKKFGSKDFAKGVSRERIALCAELGIPLEEFLALALEGMRFRSEELGL